MLNLEIKKWEVDAQPVEDGFASYISVEFEYENIEFEGTIQEDCGTWVEWIGDEPSFYELSEDVKEFILEKALADIKEAQKSWNDED